MSYKSIVMERSFRSIPEGCFEKAEQLIGVKFPYPLYELVKNNNEGCPKDNEIYLPMPGETSYGANRITCIFII